MTEKLQMTNFREISSMKIDLVDFSTEVYSLKYDWW